MAETVNHYLTPTYQSLLISSIQTAAIRLSTVNGNPADVWTALRVLFIIIPQECKEDVQKHFNQIQSQLSKLGNNPQFDYYMKRETIAINTKNYLYTKNVELFEAIVESLDKRNYLEKRRKDITSNTSPATQQLFGE